MKPTHTYQFQLDILNRQRWQIRIGARYMNSSFQRVSADSLPTILSTALSCKKVLKCFHAADLFRYVVWVVNDTTKRQQELEFDVKAARFLSRSERAAELDAPFYTEYKDLNVKVKV